MITVKEGTPDTTHSKKFSHLRIGDYFVWQVNPHCLCAKVSNHAYIKVESKCLWSDSQNITNNLAVTEVSVDITWCRKQ